MNDYICNTIVSVDYLSNGKWAQKRLGMKNTSGKISNEELLELICDYYPTVTKDNVLFMIRRDGDEVRLSDVDTFIESVRCRSLADKDFNIGEIVVVNTELFDKYVGNTKYGLGV